MTTDDGRERCVLVAERPPVGQLLLSSDWTVILAVSGLCLENDICTPEKHQFFLRARACRRSHQRLHRGEAREEKPLEIVKTQVEANQGGYARHFGRTWAMLVSSQKVWIRWLGRRA